MAAARSLFHMLSDQSCQAVLLAVVFKNKWPNDFTIIYFTIASCHSLTVMSLMKAWIKVFKK